MQQTFHFSSIIFFFTEIEQLVFIIEHRLNIIQKTHIHALHGKLSLIWLANLGSFAYQGKKIVWILHLLAKLLNTN